MTGTTVVSDVVEIDAPAAAVWSVMVDFDRYGEWNPFCVAVDGVFALGEPVVLHTPDPLKPGGWLLMEIGFSIVQVGR